MRVRHSPSEPSPAPRFPQVVTFATDALQVSQQNATFTSVVLGATYNACPSLDFANLELTGFTSASANFTVSLAVDIDPNSEANFLRTCLTYMAKPDGDVAYARFLPQLAAALQTAGLPQATWVNLTAPVVVAAEYDLIVDASASFPVQTIYNLFSSTANVNLIAQNLLANVPNAVVTVTGLTIPLPPPPSPPPPPGPPPPSPDRKSVV